MAFSRQRPTDLGAYLIQESARLGLTTGALAVAAKLQPGTVIRAIYVDEPLSAAICQALAEALDVPYGTVALLGGCVDADTIEPPTE
jgi:cyanate lyase